MATNNFPSPILKPKILRHEGGKVDDPRDPGGRTNQGVIQRTYNAWRRSRGRVARNVYLMAPNERDEIYRERYWNKVWGDYLPSGLDYTIMDYAVNSGPSRSIKHFQEVEGKPTDGVMGPVTLGAVNAMRKTPDGDFDELQVVASIKRVNARRMRFLRGLRHWPTYKNGWSRRVRETEADSIELARKKGNVKRDGAAGAGGGAVVIEDQLPPGTLEDLFGVPSLPDGAFWILIGVVAVVIAFNHRAWLAQRVRSARNWVGDMIEARFRLRRFTALRADIRAQAATLTIEGD